MRSRQRSAGSKTTFPQTTREDGPVAGAALPAGDRPSFRIRTASGCGGRCGVDLAYQDLEGDWPEGFHAGPTENREDEDIAMDPDEDLPWPATDLVAR